MTQSSPGSAPPSPLAGEGVMRSVRTNALHSPWDEGSRAKRDGVLDHSRKAVSVCSTTPHPTGFAGHLPPQGGKGRLELSA
jgi:hypothetical protein